MSNEHSAESDSPVYLCPHEPECGDICPAPTCRCGCPPSMHVGEIGCPCALPGDPPCVTPPEVTP